MQALPLILIYLSSVINNMCVYKNLCMPSFQTHADACTYMDTVNIHDNFKLIMLQKPRLWQEPSPSLEVYWQIKQRKEREQLLKKLMTVFFEIIWPQKNFFFVSILVHLHWSVNHQVSLNRSYLLIYHPIHLFAEEHWHYAKQQQTTPLKDTPATHPQSWHNIHSLYFIHH